MILGEHGKKFVAITTTLDLDETTPVGLFPNGASPYGLLDMTARCLGVDKEYLEDRMDGRERYGAKRMVFCVCCVVVLSSDNQYDLPCAVQRIQA